MASLLVLACLAGAARAQAECADWQAVFESVEGTVELRRASTAAWGPARASQHVCTGDAVRTGASGRAAIRLPDRTLVRLDRNSSITFAVPDNGTGSLLDLLRGIIHVISRDPRSLRFSTPYANAGLEGTEFTIETDARRALITVIEGEVVVSNAQARVDVGPGRTATAEASRPISAATVADPFAAVRWAAHFAPVLPGALPDVDAPAPDGAGRAEFLARRAAARAVLGRFADAAADVAAALALEPSSPTALAVRTPLELAAGDKDAALRTARAAIEANPASAAAWIALAQAHSAHFDYAAAATAARRATAAEPGNALALARLAELELALGASRNALASARAAGALDPSIPDSHVVEGFAHLRLGDAAGAAAAFEQALSVDRSAPLPHIGLGLAAIRDGELERGRDALELAVALDPANARLRSQVARVYAAEHRGELAAVQTELARALDPVDPSAYLLGALVKQADNRLVAAFDDLHTATLLGDGTGLFRSSFRMNEDLALRSAGLGRLYRDLDFTRLALLDGWRASVRDARDYAPRRLLADVYSTRPRHQIARVNALWQSQLLQPLNVRPVPPQLAEANMFILDSAGPSDLAFNEFGALLDRDGMSVQGSGVAGGHETRGADFELAGLHGGLSYSIGAFTFESAGFRANNDIERSVANALVQYRAGPATSLFGELRSATTDKGDLSLRFDLDSFLPQLRQTDDVESVRLGVRHDLSERGTIVAAAIRDDVDTSVSTGPLFSSESMSRSDTVDVAHLHSAGSWQLQSGVRHFDQSASDTSGLLSLGTRHTSAYAYSDVHLTSQLTATFGFSADSLDARYSVDRLNPKLGLMWRPDPATTVRAAAFRTLQGPFVSKQIIQPRLEPTHVAGFNQFFFGAQGERTARLGVGVDRRHGKRLFSGFELSGRELERPITTVLPGMPPLTELAAGSERGLSAYVYWAPAERLGLSAEYEFLEIESERVSFEGHTELKTTRLPITLNWFHGSRLQTRITASLVDQRGSFAAGPAVPIGPSAPLEHARDRFTVVDFALSYRLPRRLGKLSLEARNLFDKRFNFQDVDAENTRYFPERTLSLRLTLSR